MHRLQTKPINNVGRIALFNFRSSLQNVSPPLQSLLALTSLFQVCRQEKNLFRGDGIYTDPPAWNVCLLAAFL